MFDVTDCYVVVFTDQAGTVHAVPFAKADKGNEKAKKLLAAVESVGLKAAKYGPYTGAPASKVPA